MDARTMAKWLRVFTGLAFCVILQPDAFRALSAQAATPGLVAFWRMEAGDGNSVVDTSGHGYTLSLVGAPSQPAWSTDAPSLSGGNGHSLAFDGVDDFSYMGGIPETAGSTQLTVETWVKFDSSPTNYQVIASAFQWSLQTQWLLTTNGANGVRVYISPNSVGGYCCDSLGIPYGESLASNLQSGQWYHIAFVYFGGGASNADRLKIYVDGVSQSMSYYGSLPVSIPVAYPAVRLGSEGRPGYLPNAPLHGKLDDFRVYTLARSQSDIEANAQGSVEAVTPELPQSLAAYWQMEEGSGGSVVDSSGHGYDQSLVTSPADPQWSSDVPVLTGGNDHSLAFDGTDDYTYTAGVPEMAGSPELTVETWVKFDSAPINSQIIASAFQWSLQTQWLMQSTSANELRVYISPNSVGGFCCDSLNLPYGETVGANLQAGQWTHIAFVYNGNGATNSDRLKLFINGNPRPVLFHGDIVPNLPAAYPAVRLGNEGRPGYIPNAPLHGKLDEFRIYMAARSPADIEMDAAGQVAAVTPPPDPTPTPTPGPSVPAVADWRMEEGAGTVAADSSSNGNDQQLTASPSNPTWSTDVPALLAPNDTHSLSFNGSGAYSAATGVPQMSSAAQLTLETWVKFDSTPSNNQTLASAFQWGQQTQWLLETSAVNELRLYLTSAAAAGGCCDSLGLPYAETVGANLQSGQWYHVAVVFDGSAAANKVQMYIDGTPRPVLFYGTMPVELSSAHPEVKLGNEDVFTYGPHTALNGKLDNFRIYTVARSGADIAADANGTSVETPTPSVTTFTVNTTDDTHDDTPGDGICADAGEFCSLRTAIEEANALPGTNAIVLPAGTYTLTVGSELYATSDIMLNGAGAATTIVQANAATNTATYRVLHNNGGVLFIDGVTIQNGVCSGACTVQPGNGGGILNEVGTLTLDASTVSSNKVSGWGALGGGIYNQATLVVQNGSLIGGVSAGNSADGPCCGATAAGGGIFNTGATTIDHSTVSANTTIGYGGGISSNGTLIVRNNSLIGGAGAGNWASWYGRGGGIDSVGTATIDASTVSHNAAGNGSSGGIGGGIFNGNVLTIQNGSLITANGSTGGGGIAASAISTTIDASTVSANAGTFGGGGIQNGGNGALIIRNGSIIGGRRKPALLRQRWRHPELEWLSHDRQ